MADEKKTVDWSELEGVDDLFTKTINCPKLSEQLGKEINVKIRAIDRMEFLGAINFPLDELNQMVNDNAEPEAYVKAIQEQTQALGIEGLLDTMECVIKIGLVEPDPADGKMGKLSLDYETIFQGIVDLTLPPGEVGEAAAFRPDGE